MVTGGNVNDESEWKFILISTCGANDRPDLLQRMINSVTQAEEQLKGRVELYLLLQQCSKESLANFSISAPSFIRPYCYSQRVPLSAARNRLLLQALDAPLSWQRVIVAFPDDDAWYPPGTLETIVKAFASDKRLGFWFCRYGSAPGSAVQPAFPSTRQPSLGETIRRASSNTIFLRGDLVRRIGKFDETLGVGTENGSGEDTDFAIKAFAIASRTLYFDAVAIGHRDLDPGLRARYYRGSLITLGRYAGVVKGMYREFIRKLIVGCYLVLRGDLTVRGYLSAMSGAVLSLGTAKLP
jgi:hypothetical protein